MFIKQNTQMLVASYSFKNEQITKESHFVSKMLLNGILSRSIIKDKKTFPKLFKISDGSKANKSIRGYYFLSNSLGELFQCEVNVKNKYKPSAKKFRQNVTEVNFSLFTHKISTQVGEWE